MTDAPKSTTKIIINGQEVGPEKVPEILRQFVVDADRNGVPDFLDQFFKNPLFKMLLGKSGEQLQSQLRNMKNLTPEQQEKIAKLLEKLGGIGGSGVSVTTTSSITPGFRPSPSTPQIDYRQLGLQDPEQKRTHLGLIFVALLGVMIAAALWILMRS